MAIGDFGASSFDAYEGIRIVIPGFVVSTVTFYTYREIVPGSHAGGADAVLSVAASLVVGLVLYFWDIPAKSAAFSQDQPTLDLEKMFPTRKRGELLTAYFHLLNTEMPAVIRNRALYMGSMYRIGLEAILCLSFAVATVFAASLLNYDADVADDTSVARQTAAAALLIVLLIAIVIGRGYERKTARRVGRQRSGAVAQIGGDTWKPSMVIYLLLLAGVVVPTIPAVNQRIPDGASRITAAVSLMLLLAFWVRRYVLGDRNKAAGGVREPMHPVSSGLLLVVPWILVLALYAPPSKSVLNSPQKYVPWTALASVVTLTVIIRGHERKLHGVYASQRQWLRAERKQFEELLPDPPDAEGQEPKQGGATAAATGQA